MLFIIFCQCMCHLFKWMKWLKVCQGSEQLFMWPDLWLIYLKEMCPQNQHHFLQVCYRWLWFLCFTVSPGHKNPITIRILVCTSVNVTHFLQISSSLMGWPAATWYKHAWRKDWEAASYWSAVNICELYCCCTSKAVSNLGPVTFSTASRCVRDFFCDAGSVLSHTAVYDTGHWAWVQLV